MSIRNKSGLPRRVAPVKILPQIWPRGFTLPSLVSSTASGRIPRRHAFPIHAFSKRLTNYLMQTPPKKKKSKKSKSRKVEGNFYEIGKGGRKPHIPQEPDVSTDDSVLFGTDTEKMGGSVPPRGPSGYPSMAVKPSSRPAYKPPSSSRPAYQPSSSGGRPAYRPPSRPSSAPPAYAQGSDSESDGGAEMKQLLGPDGQPLQISQPIPTGTSSFSHL